MKYDSVHGHFPGDVEVKDDSINVNGQVIKVYSIKKPENLPWKELEIDIVIESTGNFATRNKAIKHVTHAGAKK